MNLLRPLLKLWLNLECQMVQSCSAALLVQLTELGEQKVVSSWPENQSIDKAMVLAASEVMAKKRIHLERVEDKHETVFLGHPILIDEVFWGAIVVHIDKPSTKDMQAVVKILKWGMTWLQFLLYQDEINSTASALTEHQDSSKLVSFLLTSLKEKTLEETAIAVVNFIASQYEFDRVSLGLTHSKKIELSAVSFSASFDPRTQPMQNITQAMQEAVSQRRGIGHSLETEANLNETDTITRCHQILLEEHRLKNVSTLLIRKDEVILGAVTIEQTRSTILKEDNKAHIEKSLNVIASIIQLKVQAQLGLKQKLGHRFFNFLARCFGSQHPLEKLILSGTIAFIVLLFVPADYNITCDAVLQSSNKHILVSPHDGFIGSVHVKPGDAVKESQILVSLKDEEMKLERRRVSSQLQQYKLEYDNALATGDRAQAAILDAQVDKGKAELRLIEQKLERTRLKSPIDGVIISEDISQSLGAPTTQGEILFEIANKQEYFVQLFVNEKDISSIKENQLGKLSLASLPGEHFGFLVERITPISEIKDGRNYFRLDARLSAPSTLLRPGMTGKGKVHIEKRGLGWIWFHELWHWLRLTFWF